MADFLALRNCFGKRGVLGGTVAILAAVFGLLVHQVLHHVLVVLKLLLQVLNQLVGLLQLWG